MFRWYHNVYDIIFEILEYKLGFRIIFLISILITMLCAFVTHPLVSSIVSIFILSILEFFDYKYKKYSDQFEFLLKIYSCHILNLMKINVTKNYMTNGNSRLSLMSHMNSLSDLLNYFVANKIKSIRKYYKQYKNMPSKYNFEKLNDMLDMQKYSKAKQFFVLFDENYDVIIPELYEAETKNEPT